MPKRARQILATLALLLGIAHIIYGFVIYGEKGLSLFWFQSFGLAMIVTALANFQRGKIWILRVQNALALLFIGVLAYLTPQPQVLIGCALFAGLFVLSILGDNTQRL